MENLEPNTNQQTEGERPAFTSGMNTVPVPAKKSKLLPFLLCLVILFLLAIGGLYIWGSRLDKQEKKEEMGVSQSGNTLSASSSPSLAATSTDESLDSIESEAQNVDVGESDNFNYTMDQQ